MKKANRANILIIIIIYGLFYIVNLLLRKNNIDIYFDVDVTSSVSIIILIIAYLLLMVTSTLNASYQTFKRYIKYQRKTKIAPARYALLLSSVLMGYIYFLFEVEYYYYFGSVILT